MARTKTHPKVGKSLYLSLTIATFGLAGVSVVFAGDADHECTVCHPEQTNICSTTQCASNEVCSGSWGGSGEDAWVIAECEPDPR